MNLDRIERLYNLILTNEERSEEYTYDLLKTAISDAIKLVGNYQRDLQKKHLYLDDLVKLAIDILYFTYSNYHGEERMFYKMLKRNIKYFITENNFNIPTTKEINVYEELRQYVNSHLSLIILNDLHGINMEFSKLTRVHFVILDLYNKISVEEKEILRRKLGIYNSEKKR